jgi:hypothetical protein
MIFPPCTPWCSSTCVDVIALVILWRTSRCSCLNRLYWILHYLCKNHYVTSHRLIWAFWITSKSWVLNIQQIQSYLVYKIRLRTRGWSNVETSLPKRGKSLNKPFQNLLYCSDLSIINKSCHHLINRYNALACRYNISGQY